MWVESEGKPRAYSVKSARGLWQIMESVLYDYNIVNSMIYTKYDLYDPYVNHRVAMWQYDRLHKQFNSAYVKVVNSWNMGHRNTKRGLYYGDYVYKILGDDFVSFTNSKRVTKVRPSIIHVSE
jgi:soluble lytic murein transglycosylase-like protein